MTDASRSPLVQVGDGLWFSQSIVDRICEVGRSYEDRETQRLNSLVQAKAIMESVMGSFQDAPEQLSTLDKKKIQELVRDQPVAVGLDSMVLETAEWYIASHIEQMEKKTPSIARTKNLSHRRPAGIAPP